MAQDLWPSRRKAKDDEGVLNSLLETIEEMAQRSQVRELRAIQTDLRELVESLTSLIAAIGGQKLYRQKGGVEEAVAQMRARITTRREERKAAPQAERCWPAWPHGYRSTRGEEIMTILDWLQIVAALASVGLMAFLLVATSGRFDREEG